MRGLPSKRPPQPAANADGHCRATRPVVGAVCIAVGAALRITVGRAGADRQGTDKVDKLFSHYFKNYLLNYF